MNVILVATDFSVRADWALRRAAMLARDNAARLVLVHVADDDQPEQLVAAERQAAEAMLDETIRTRPEFRDVVCTAMIVLGEPFDGIVRAARAGRRRSCRNGGSSQAHPEGRLCRYHR